MSKLANSTLSKIFRVFFFGGAVSWLSAVSPVCLPFPVQITKGERFQILRCLFLLFLYFSAKSVKCSPFLAFSWSSSFAFSSGFDKNFFTDSHGSLTAPVGNDRGGLFRSDDTVPCERFTISLAQNATATVRFCLSQHLIPLAIVDGVSLISCGASSLASRHKDFLIRIRAELSWAELLCNYRPSSVYFIVFVSFFLCFVFYFHFCVLVRTSGHMTIMWPESTW